MLMRARYYDVVNVRDFCKTPPPGPSPAEYSGRGNQSGCCAVVSHMLLDQVIRASRRDTVDRMLRDRTGNLGGFLFPQWR